LSLFSSLYEAHNPAMLKIWRILTLLMASLVVHSFIRFFLGENAALFLAVGSALAFVLLLWLSLDNEINILRQRLQGWQWLIFLLLALLGILLGSREQRDLLYIHANLLYWIFAFLFYSQIFYESKRPLRPALLLLITLGLMGLVSVVRLLGLSYYPGYQWIDEPWLFAWIIDYLKTGIMDDALYYNVTVDIHTVIYPMAYWMGLVEEPSLWFGRLYNFFLYFPFCAALAATAYHLYGKRNAFFTFIAAFACGSLYGSVHLRHDLSFMSFVAFALLAYAYGLKTKEAVWHGLAGLLVGLSLYAHYHAMGMGPMLAIGLYLPLYLAKRRGDYSAPYSYGIAFMIGGLLGAGIVYLTIVLPNWELVSEVRIERGWQGSRSPLHFLVLYPHYIYIARQFLFEQLLSFAALAMLFYQRDIKDRVLIWLFFLGPALLAVLSGGGFPHYIQHIAFVYALMIGRGLEKFLDWFPFKKQASLYMALGVLILTPLIGNSTPFFAIEEQRPLLLPDPAPVSWIKEHVQPGSVIVAPNWYALFLYQDYTFYSIYTWDASTTADKADYNNDPARFWDEINADVIIVWDEEYADRNDKTAYIDESYMLSRSYQLFLVPEQIPISAELEDVQIYVRPESLLAP
jgi:hypothetical protein